MTGEQLPRWESSMAAMASEAARLKATGRWRTGPVTLLEFLGLHEREVRMVACLGWLLRPDGHHGLGDQVVQGLLEALGVPYLPGDPVRVDLEESRRDAGRVTRADLVLRVGGRCVLIEAKINAVEHDKQCDRLADLWAKEQPMLVFLTRTGQMPSAAPSSRDMWHQLTWGQVADVIANADPAGGAEDFLHTIRAYQTERRDESLTLDSKTAFYLRHWTSIEEWAALRESGRVAVEAALKHALDQIDVPEGVVPPLWDCSILPTFSLRHAQWRWGNSEVAVALQWKPSDLMAGKWPYVGLRTSRDDQNPGLAKWLQSKLAAEATQLQWDQSGEKLWPLWRRVCPQGEGVDPQELAADCQLALMEGWQVMAPSLDELFNGPAQP
ncbi:PD-(D/E)XK nuclease family protein [Micromonospora saelicesensis]|uniref:PD-(D/E)XK nuclease family protein n=1 Tax=Micromonospora saelicesensis TaxID=285676 RepID=UPI003D8A02B9